MRIVVLDTGLFPDREIMLKAVASLTQPGRDVIMKRISTGSINSDPAWDSILHSILDADRVVTV